MSTFDCILVFLSATASLIAVAASVQLLTPYWDQVATWQMGRLSDRFDRLGYRKAKLRVFLRFWGVGVIAVFLLFWLVLEMFPVAVVVVALAYVAPRHVLDYLIRKRSRLLRDQLVGVTVGVGNAVKAGLSLAQAIESVCEETAEPLVSELRRIVFEFERGRPLGEAIDQVRRRLDLEAFTLLAVALGVAQDRGGRLSEALDRISESLQESQRLEKKLESETATGRQVVLLLALAPVVILGMFYTIAPQVMSLLFTTFAGHCTLAVVVVFVYAGTRWAARIMRVDF